MTYADGKQPTPLPGELAVVEWSREGLSIRGRNAALLFGSEASVHEIQCCTVENNSLCMYVATVAHVDGTDIDMHMIVYGDRPVWVSSTDCDLRRA
jgi:hypothetical protein